MVVQQINPEIIQIGNEINNGFLHPEGHRYSEPNQFLDLLNEGIRAVRDYSSSATKIMFPSFSFDLIGSLFTVGCLFFSLLPTCMYMVCCVF